jgi:uncharacterized membrane protein YhaH (DUF805 family)
MNETGAIIAVLVLGLLLLIIAMIRRRIHDNDEF